MSELYVIEPDNDGSSLSKLVEMSGAAGKLKELLQDAKIDKVLVNVRDKVWEVHIRTNNPLLSVDGKTFKKNITLPIKGLKGCIFQISRDPRGLSLEEALKIEWENILTELKSRQPAINGLLSMSRWRIAHEGPEEEVFVEVVDDIGVTFLSDKGCSELMEALILQRLGKKVKVRLVVGDFDDEFEEILSEQELIEKNEVEQALKEQDNRSKSALVESKGTILGRPINVEPEKIRSINDIIEEENNVIVEGMVFSKDIRLMKSGRTLATFGITDFTNSIEVKVWENEKENKVSEACNEDSWLRIKGNVQTDKFSQELTLLPSDIQIIEPYERVDSATEKRIELHLHTKMSAMDAVIDVERAVQQCAKWGHPAIAITDHGVVQSHPAAFDAGQKYGVKILYGLEGYLANSIDSARDYHIIIIAKNDTGLRNLYKLVSISHLDDFHRHPRIIRDKLVELREGLILGAACEAGELYQAIISGKSEDEIDEIANFYDYLEIQPIGNNEFMLRNGQVTSEDDLKDFNRKIFEIGKKLGKPVVATSDAHFLDPHDEVFRRILMAGQGYEDADLQPPLYFRTTDEMLEELSYLGKESAREAVIINPKLIADMVQDLRPVPDKLYTPTIDGAEEQIQTMAYNKARELYGDTLPEIVEARLKKELKSIIENSFSVIYLIAHKLVTKSLSDDYLVGSRGSVGSSFVATMCDITEVNPLPPHYRCGNCKYSEFSKDAKIMSGFDLQDKDCPVCGEKLYKDGQDIPFEVFLGFKGDKVPDIDLNFSSEYQERIHKYTEELFGSEHVYRAATLSTLMDRTAYGFVKKYFEERTNHIRTIEINRLVKGCCGVKRTTGQHPGGLMIIPQDRDVHEFTPLQYPANDKKSNTITTHFEYGSFKERLLKLDLLGHTDPTQLRMLQDITGVDVKRIPLDDLETMKLFSGLESLGISREYAGGKVGTLGVPEFGTPFVRQMLEATLPTTFAELIRISGLSHGTDVWLNNAADLIAGETATLTDVIAMRDDIMNYLISCGVESSKAFKIMENVRKGRGLSAEDEECMKAAEVPAWYCESAKKIKYLFPKAHAAAYVTMAFRLAYFKVHYPAPFYASYFTVKADAFDVNMATMGKEELRAELEKLRAKGNDATPKEAGLLEAMEVALEAITRGVTFLNVDLQRSRESRFQVKAENILPPFIALPGLGASAAKNIVIEREKKPFTSIEDLKVRARLSKTVIEILKESNVLTELPESNQLTLF